MTKKKTTTSTKSIKQTKTAKPPAKSVAKSKVASARKPVSKKTDATVQPKIPVQSKPKSSKLAGAAKSQVQKAGAKKKVEGKVLGKATRKKVSRDSDTKEVESKVREIVSKNNLGKVEQKKASRGFSLDDVRSVLKIKSEGTSKKSKGKKKIEPVEIKVPEKALKVSKKSSKVKKLQTASIDDILGFGVALGPTRPIRDAKKVPKDWLPYYNDLMDLRASLKGALGERSQDTLGASARESSGELSLNSPDAGSETFNRDVALSMVATEQEALEEIEDAIDRIFEGSFGVCQETNKPIKKSRLKVVPFTRFSLEGQTLHEQRKHKEKDSGGGTFATIADSTMGVEE